MTALSSRRSLPVLLALAALFLSPPREAGAHPQLAGDWFSPSPPGGSMVYHFDCGYLLGRGIWRGKYTLTVSDCVVICGVYELRMFNDREGTLATRDDMFTIGSAVGTVDLGAQQMRLQNVSYTHRPHGPAAISVTPTAP